MNKNMLIVFRPQKMVGIFQSTTARIFSWIVAAGIAFIAVIGIRQQKKLQDAASSEEMQLKQIIDERNQVAQELDKQRRHLEKLLSLRTAELIESRAAVNAARHANSVFLADMCMECRTPLNTILGFSEQILHDGEIGERNRKRLATINCAGQHILSLINDALEISRFEAGYGVIQRKVFDLFGLLNDIEETIRSHAAGKGLAFYIESATNLPNFVEGDEVHLKQVLINLLGNAVKYTDQGSVWLRVVRCKGDVSFQISDTGPGIAAGDQRRIFEPFYQTEAGAVKGKGSGSGLGLTICREYTRIMNGQLEVNSQLGYGSTFTLIVPLPAVASATNTGDSAGQN